MAELDRRLRHAVESASGSFWVEGEVSSLKRATSGHLYFTLKDLEEDASIDGVFYRFEALRAQRFVAEGEKIQIWGRATVWAPRGRLQLVGQSARPAGRGALLAALEALKDRLAAEGLFDPERKRPLPDDPRIVGVVTSRTGAAFRDIQSVAFRRGAVRLVLSPAQVQGEDAPRSLIEAIDRIERYPGLEVLIVGRGGGSGDDLMAFNDEAVVRRLARVPVPVVSAVGHEIDVSLADLVADRRAATPSQAAELVVPDSSARHAQLQQARLSVLRALRGTLVARRGALFDRRSKLSDPRFLIAERQQQLDDLSARLERRIERIAAHRRTLLTSLSARLRARHPEVVLARSRAALEPLLERLKGAQRLSRAAAEATLRQHRSRLEALSPLSVLGRGYAIVLGPDGRALRRARDAGVGQALTVRLSEGTLDATVSRLYSDDS